MIALLGHVSGDLSQIRRDNICSYLSEKIYSLSFIQVPVTDYLFGNEDDLQTRIAKLNVSNKISRVTSKKKNNYSNQSGNINLLIYLKHDWLDLFKAIEMRIRLENRLFLSIFRVGPTAPIQTETLVRSSLYSEQIKSKWEYAESAMEFACKKL